MQIRPLKPAESSAFKRIFPAYASQHSQKLAAGGE